MTITTLGVIGTGAMGSGIIEVAAKAGVVCPHCACTRAATGGTAADHRRG